MNIQKKKSKLKGKKKTRKDVEFDWLLLEQMILAEVELSQLWKLIN